MAAMSVIGIDLGNESCYIAVAKAGGIETIANDYSLRATPSYVAFSGKNRILGVAAKNQQVTNMKNTVYGLKRLLGRKFSDPHVQRELQYLPFKILEDKNGNIGIMVHYLNEEHIFSPEQCLAMLLTKLKDTASIALQTPINDCVISVPSYFTQSERKALLDSAAISGLNVLRLFNETTATALSYGIYKQDLPAPEEKPRNVIFVDCGYASLQVSACAFNRGKLKMLATAADPYLGGRDIDRMIADHFCVEFQKKYQIDAKSNPRAYIRLLAEVEKLKKQMSANSTTLPLAIECFMNDKDVKSEMKRSDMETICASMFQRVEETMKRCLQQSGLNLNDIYAVEIVGGSSRVPAIKQLIEKVFKVHPSTTLNQDEAVSRGCALQCAMLSPAVRVREFSITDVQNYPIHVSWDASPGGESAGDMEVFPVGHAIPFSKMLTFYRTEAFPIRVFYGGHIPYPDSNIGTWLIKDIRPSPDGKPQKVKAKVRINLHGIVTVSSASLIEAKEATETESPEKEKMDSTAEQQNGEQQPPQKGEEDVPMEGGEAQQQSAEDGEKDKKKKLVKSVELPIEVLTFGFSNVEINKFTEQEFKMIASDKQEKERADSRNALEEYVYELRNKVSSDDELAPFILDLDREVLVRKLDEMENWLYEEGEDCNKQVYVDKLAELKQEGEPVQQRKIEYDLRPAILEDFARALQLCMKAIELIRNKDQKYSHLTEEEVAQVEKAFQESYQWLEQTRQKLNASSLHLPPPITIAQVRQEKANFDNTVNAILNKPVPKAPSPPKEEKSTAEPNAKPDQKEENMEWS
ncbi:heat shock 70 kDa protein 4 isoform X2 [Anthonomus grandis grandis]|uniref:heat shock 70 kDa protein 4 isoform X2 n=1 Tax=Anthonomus grandis grandis TaxID=2921223 RepID=UPI00216653AE|nr:heat shock 70 kDa protein 4 isoform X2 [Anthonomus grandis grandis]